MAFLCEKYKVARLPSLTVLQLCIFIIGSKKNDKFLWNLSSLLKCISDINNTIFATERCKYKEIPLS